MKLSVIHHIAIIVSDYEKSKDFYVNKLGFEIIRENYRSQRDDWKLDLRVNDTTELEIFGVNHPPKRVNRPEAAGLRHLAFYTEDVEAAAAELKEKGIPSMVYYAKPMHHQGAFANTRSAQADCPVTERLCETVLSLPLHPYMTEQQVREISDAVRNALH